MVQLLAAAIIRYFAAGGGPAYYPGLWGTRLAVCFAGPRSGAKLYSTWAGRAYNPWYRSPVLKGATGARHSEVWDQVLRDWAEVNGCEAHLESVQK